MASNFEAVATEYSLDDIEQRQLNDLIVSAVRIGSILRAIECSNASEKIKKAAAMYFRYQQLSSEVGG